jgi:hypothetical protein
MTRKRVWSWSLVATAIVLSAASYAAAGIIYVTDTNGNVWQYNSMSQMGLQTQSNNAGILVRDASVAGADYKDDQDATADLSTGTVYRINANGDIISYINVAAYLANVNPVTEATGIYGGTKKINGLSYNGATGGFYAVPATGSTNAGDIIQFTSSSAFLLGTPDGTALTTANYVNAVLNFYDPDAMQGTSVGPTPAPHAVSAKYYQVAGNGRLEGFTSLSEYNSNSNNRIEITGLNAFGGTTPTYQARGAFAILVPEPASVLLMLSALFSRLIGRRRSK